ncbi:uncharacterized protein F5147DRAFT_787202 [Suillus discolor]|uniref:Uncharacterized protein n=1 Tax=Suillus discolor TaxID=1912936 RepID=A0A9P7ETV5_9AGAM|nr:uncharacterized protein F5147DRAFT_787202 [Suillus discolor]KAG2090492.1 hypothetical protein F5147DRAFT_787202 [Suillus discolor]
MQQTIKCAFFICDYANTQGSLAQVIKNSVLNVESEIKEFENAFKDLQHSFQSQLAVSPQFTVLKILEDVQDLGTQADFCDMRYAIDARCAASYAIYLLANSAVPPADLTTSLQSWVIKDSKESERILELEKLMNVTPSWCTARARGHTIAYWWRKRLGKDILTETNNEIQRYSNALDVLMQNFTLPDHSLPVPCSQL